MENVTANRDAASEDDNGFASTHSARNRSVSLVGYGFFQASIIHAVINIIIYDILL